MSRDDAATIVAMIVHGWPGPVWEAERLEAYVQGIISWDAAITTRALARARNALKYRPSIAELREFVQIEQRAKISEQEQISLILPEKPFKPDWVSRWERARKAGDMRLFPEQAAGLNALCRQSPEDFKAYRLPEAETSDESVWVQEGEYGSGEDAIVTAP